MTYRPKSLLHGSNCALDFRHVCIGRTYVKSNRQNVLFDGVIIKFAIGKFNYDDVFVFNKTNNHMTSRSTPVIALLESNEEDGHYFMSLDSGKRINSRKWTPLPITSEVIARVDELVTSSKQDVLVNNLPTFEWSRGVSVADQIIPYEEEVPVHDEEADDPHVPIIDNPFKMVGMISDDVAGPRLQSLF